MRQPTTESKAMQTLRQTQRAADTRAREAMSEARQMLDLASDIERKLREMTQERDRKC